MINNVNAIKSENTDAVKASEKKEPVKISEKSAAEKISQAAAQKASEKSDISKKEKEKAALEAKVYEQMEKNKDTLELSDKGKGLSEYTIRSMQASMQQNKLNLVLNMSSQSARTKKQIGISAEESVSLISAYNTGRYLAKDAYKMYFNKKNDSELDEINSLKEQISALEKEIDAEEKKNAQKVADKDKAEQKADSEKGADKAKPAEEK